MKFPRHAKSWIKSAVANVLYWTGLLSMMASRRLKGRAVVLMYHRVLPAELASRSFSHPGIIVTPESFSRHMDFLKRKFSPLSLAEFHQHMESGTPFPDGACLVTFDDGWVDNYDYALPILRERGIPAVVFVATDYIGSNRPFWQERLGHLLYQASHRGLCQPVLHAHDILLPSPSDDAALRRAIADTVDRFRSEPYEKIDGLLKRMENALALAGLDQRSSPSDRFMTWPQVRAMSEHGITVASHCSSHRLLTRLDEVSVTAEFKRSGRQIETTLGSGTCALAYPGGSHDENVRQSAIQSGYRLGFTTNSGTADAQKDPLSIPRINVHESSASTIPLFLSRVLGIL
jgi:peptidoglycan/xylan/chitin deacetylase (PgdA/CDA1 family)